MGEGEKGGGGKAKMTPNTGGKSVSEKSQATRTSKNCVEGLQEIIQSVHRILCSCSEGQTDWEERS